ncbi:BZ3500_MvSof-1268-A1-R1_Chr5-2g07744 [Microbotryum saponariae]|uniref:BZ3500_MvSof-1268-A1-R1_Chr5-2g07744 protein n=1 Tax=Microbotryum saponariae TaxID=289078 RepID=A0A2X0KFK1_9BASI|nr:BZ3500_MvSof-1268-A1-R1_Chr5-2g07744 [Microbotryum saponariae]SDA05613.1 BZ3501_MvSof-1269-A2-R1_Chr5-2g07566 [Microbotryum saponariae]
MKTFFLRSSLLALATCALGASATVTNPSEQHEPFDLDKRTFGLIPLSPCGIFKGGMSGISTYSSLSLNLGLTARVRCPLTFRCDGSGTDGHLYDINGLPVPSCFPSTWRYFGIKAPYHYLSERGWQPPASFSCGSSWTVPTAWCPSVHLAPWFRPGPGVALSYSSGLNIPSWWLPSAGWSCSGNLGIGGYAFDPYGQGPPIGASGFLYFGLGRGWLPPAGLSIDVNFVSLGRFNILRSCEWDSRLIPYPRSFLQVFPSGCGNLHLATWWSPPIEWVPPPKFGCPIWWKCRRCQSPTTSVTLSLPAPTTTTSAATIAQTTAPQSPTTSHHDGEHDHCSGHYLVVYLGFNDGSSDYLDCCDDDVQHHEVRNVHFVFDVHVSPPPTSHDRTQPPLRAEHHSHSPPPPSLGPYYSTHHHVDRSFVDEYFVCFGTYFDFRFDFDFDAFELRGSADDETSSWSSLAWPWSLPP